LLELLNPEIFRENATLRAEVTLWKDPVGALFLAVTKVAQGARRRLREDMAIFIFTPGLIRC
jgi:hypothetical protein